MRKSIIKLTGITLFSFVILFASCKEASTETADLSKNETEPEVELKITTPQPSPLAKVEQKVGLTDVTIEYSRPGMKGRTIFGDLVPYGQTWRTGANANTKVTFSSDVTIDGQTLEAGTYALYTVPNEKNWDVMFYSDSDNWGTPREWDDTKVVAKTTVPVYDMPMDIETFTITVDDVTNDSAVIGLLWEKAYAGVEFETPTDKMVVESIDKVLAAEPKAADYYNAAVYYSQNDKDIQKANEWMEKAMSMTEEPAFWQLRQQSLIYAKMGEKEKAIETAKKSLEGAKAADNANYIKMNEASLKEWGAM
jgi:hypothetical protein